jgi:hypothetical protein
MQSLAIATEAWFAELAAAFFRFAGEDWRTGRDSNPHQRSAATRIE